MSAPRVAERAMLERLSERRGVLPEEPAAIERAALLAVAGGA